LTRLTFSIKRNPNISFKAFKSWGIGKLGPDIVMSNIAQNHSISFKIFFTSHLQTLGILERRYDAMLAVLLPDAETAKLFFEDKAIASLCAN
jgi:hypothetical protein